MAGAEWKGRSTLEFSSTLILRASGGCGFPSFDVGGVSKVEVPTSVVRKDCKIRLAFLIDETEFGRSPEVMMDPAIWPKSVPIGDGVGSDVSANTALEGETLRLCSSRGVCVVLSRSDRRVSEVGVGGNASDEHVLLLSLSLSGYTELLSRLFAFRFLELVLVGLPEDFAVRRFFPALVAASFLLVAVLLLVVLPCCTVVEVSAGLLLFPRCRKRSVHG